MFSARYFLTFLLSLFVMQVQAQPLKALSETTLVCKISHPKAWFRSYDSVKFEIAKLDDSDPSFKEAMKLSDVLDWGFRPRVGKFIIRSLDLVVALMLAGGIGLFLVGKDKHMNDCGIGLTIGAMALLAFFRSNLLFNRYISWKNSAGVFLDEVTRAIGDNCVVVKFSNDQEKLLFKASLDTLVQKFPTLKVTGIEYLAD